MRSTTATRHTSEAARFVSDVGLVEAAAGAFVSTVASGTSWRGVVGAARAYVAALARFDGELLRAGFTGKALVASTVLEAADRSVIAVLSDARSVAPPPQWQADLQRQAAALASLEGDLGLARAGAVLEPTLGSWSAGHAALLGTFSNDFKRLGVAISATARAMTPSTLAELHQACAALRTLAKADQDVPVPSAQLQRSWGTALGVIGNGASGCLEGISELDTAVLGAGLTQLAQGESLLRAFLAKVQGRGG